MKVPPNFFIVEERLPWFSRGFQFAVDGIHPANLATLVSLNHSQRGITFWLDLWEARAGHMAFQTVYKQYLKDINKEC